MKAVAGVETMAVNVSPEDQWEVPGETEDSGIWTLSPARATTPSP